MVSATLGRVISRLKELDISITVFSALIGIERTQVQQAFRGIKYLGSDVELDMFKVTMRLAQLLPVLEPSTDLVAGDFAGIRFDRTDWYSLKRLLDSGVTADELRECRTKIFGAAPDRPITNLEQNTRA